MPPPPANPVSMFKWEDSSALEHSCWACTTKSNSPRAIHTCYGIHSIPCMAYHTTMHAIGTSHRCSGCAVSREVHDSRHREIAGLVAEYHAADFVLEAAPRRRAFTPRAANMQLRNLVHVDENHDAEGEEATDENDARSLGRDTVSTITSSSDDQGPFKLTKAEQRERKRHIKAEKSIQKATRNESRHVPQVTTEDVKRVELILHGSQVDKQTQTHPLATDKTIEDVITRNLGFVRQIQSHKVALYQSVKAGRKEEQERKRLRFRVSQGAGDVDIDTVIDAILVKLGIDDTGEPCTKKRNPTLKPRTNREKGEGKVTVDKTKVVLKLREAIRDDLEKHENDLRQTCIRAGGFFRYAGKTVFERMTEIAKTVDLQTGEKKKQEGQDGGAQVPKHVGDDNEGGIDTEDEE